MKRGFRLFFPHFPFYGVISVTRCVPPYKYRKIVRIVFKLIKLFKLYNDCNNNGEQAAGIELPAVVLDVLQHMPAWNTAAATPPPPPPGPHPPPKDCKTAKAFTMEVGTRCEGDVGGAAWGLPNATCCQAHCEQDPRCFVFSYVNPERYIGVNCYDSKY